MVLLRKHQRYMTALLISTSIVLLLYFQNSVLVFTKGSYGFISKKVLCACSICVTDRGNSHWFSERYDPNVPLLLNSTNSVLSANVSRWWKVRNTAAKSIYSPCLPWFCGQGCIYLIQFLIYFKNVIYFCGAKLNFQHYSVAKCNFFWKVIKKRCGYLTWKICYWLIFVPKTEVEL